MFIESVNSYAIACERAQAMAKLFNEEIEVANHEGKWLIRGPDSVARTMKLFWSIYAQEHEEVDSTVYEDEGSTDGADYDDEQARAEIIEELTTSQDDWQRSENNGWFDSDDD